MYYYYLYYKEIMVQKDKQPCQGHTHLVDGR